MIYGTLEDYSFEISTNFLDQKSLNLYTWKTKRIIDYTRYLVKPTVYLMVDEINDPAYGNTNSSLAAEVNEDKEAESETPKFNETIKSSLVYFAALKYAYLKGGSMKVFHKSEDMRRICDGDILVYVGEVSRKIAHGFKDAYDVEVYSGLEVRKKIK